MINTNEVKGLDGRYWVIGKPMMGATASPWMFYGSSIEDVRKQAVWMGLIVISIEPARAH